MDSVAEKSGFQCPAASDAGEARGAAVAVPRRVKRSRSGIQPLTLAEAFRFERPVRTREHAASSPGG
eukprot:2044864-Prymnesium_polylepis.1